jgi:hypothetical protein
VTTLSRIAWTERSRSDDRTLLVIDLRPIAGVAVGAILIGTPLLAAPLGRLSSPFALLVALPPLALALEAFGWRDRLARRLGRIRRPLLRLLTAYAVWLLTSAVLTLDVAAVAAASVGIAVAGHREAERRWQLGGAILGANVGSLLLPFSNLTNLVLVSASGVGFAAYVSLSIAPQIAAALAVGVLLALRARRSIADPAEADEDQVRDATVAESPTGLDDAARAAGVVAVLGAAAAIAVGLAVEGVLQRQVRRVSAIRPTDRERSGGVEVNVLEQRIHTDAAPTHVELGPFGHAADVDRPLPAGEGQERLPGPVHRLADKALDGERPPVQRRSRSRSCREDREVRCQVLAGR